MTTALDTIVVGAGLSGLVCAARLRAAGQRVVVLEARDRIGGRLHTGMLANTPIDLGGQWMSVGQPRLAALTRELGVATFPQRRDGAPLFAIDGRHRLASAIARWRAARRIERLARRPPTADTALAAWLAAHVPHRTAADLLALHAELVFATDAPAISLLHYLDVFARTGGFSPRGSDLPGGGREHRFAGGAQALAIALAARLGDAVQLDTPVRAVLDDGDTVRVQCAPPAQAAQCDPRVVPAPRAPSTPHDDTAPPDRDAVQLGTSGRDGGIERVQVAPRAPSTPGRDGGIERVQVAPRAPSTLHDDTAPPDHAAAAPPVHAGARARVGEHTATSLVARRVVLALPPPLARAIAPALPALPPVTMGGVVKCFAAYDRPFWRDAGLSGEAFRPSGDVRATVALDPPPTGGASILLAFVIGGAARRWHARPAADRRDHILAILVEQFGERAASPLAYTEADWTIDPFSTGCVAALPPGAFVPPAAWRAPHGRIHLAGTETADAWPGYMEGAIEAGERAAAEVLASAP